MNSPAALAQHRRTAGVRGRIAFAAQGVFGQGCLKIIAVREHRACGLDAWRATVPHQCVAGATPARIACAGSGQGRRQRSVDTLCGYIRDF